MPLVPPAAETEVANGVIAMLSIGAFASGGFFEWIREVLLVACCG